MVAKNGWRPCGASKKFYLKMAKWMPNYAKRISAILSSLKNPRDGRGDEFAASKKIKPAHEPKWYVDDEPGWRLQPCHPLASHQ